jgi:hypothetical protein
MAEKNRFEANQFRKAVPSLPVKDVLHEEYRSRGVTIILDPQDEPWGERHMAIADLYGHEIHFSSRTLCAVAPMKVHPSRAAFTLLSASFPEA